MTCEHLITVIRVRRRWSEDHELAGQPQLVGHQCVACGVSVEAVPGQRWLPKYVWRSMQLEDWVVPEDPQLVLVPNKDMDILSGSATLSDGDVED